MFEDIYRYLYENSGSVIKNEAAKALGLHDADAKKAMLEDPTVRYWISCTQEFYNNQRVHDSFDTRLENWMHKLFSFGVGEDDDGRIKKVNARVLAHIIENAGNEKFFDSVSNVIAASHLACMGYRDDAVVNIIKQRIDTVYEFAKNFDYDIYADKKNYPPVPKARDMHPLIKPELYEGGILLLPTVHDMFAFSNLPGKLQKDASSKRKIETIIQYILTDEYQKLPWGYGLVLVPPKKYYGLGWSVKLSRYFEEEENHAADPIVWETELMSHFEAARKSGWFKKRIKHLEAFKTDGLYEFPPNYLSESRDKYYVGGGHMGLGENRRKKDWRRLESTAWMMRIMKNI